jgi:hypothetical protein
MEISAVRAAMAVLAVNEKLTTPPAVVPMVSHPWSLVADKGVPGGNNCVATESVPAWWPSLRLAALNAR